MALIKDDSAKSEKKQEKELNQVQNLENVKDEKGLESEPTITLTLAEIDALLEKKLKEKELSREESKGNKKQEEVVQNIVNTDKISTLENFEYKDRRYEILGDDKSVSYTLRSRGDKKQSLQYIDPITKQPYSLRLTSNQPSFFEEKQPKEPGSCKIRYINFKDGRLFVPASDIMLQQFLSIHPDLNVIFKELDSAKEAKIELDILELKFKAVSLVRKLDLAKQDAIARMICDDYSESWTSGEMRASLFKKIDIYKKPKEIISYCEDESLLIQSLARTAVKRGYLNYRDYRFYDEDGTLVLPVNRVENEYVQIGNYLLSNDGNKLREYLENKLF